MTTRTVLKIVSLLGICAVLLGFGLASSADPVDEVGEVAASPSPAASSLTLGASTPPSTDDATDDATMLLVAARSQNSSGV